jgi:hypothetical protein
MSEDVKQLLVDIVEYFQMEDGIPVASIHTEDGWQWGPVDDDLIEILTRVVEAIEAEEN